AVFTPAPRAAEAEIRVPAAEAERVVHGNRNIVLPGVLVEVAVGRADNIAAASRARGRKGRPVIVHAIVVVILADRDIEPVRRGCGEDGGSGPAPGKSDGPDEEEPVGRPAGAAPVEAGVVLIAGQAARIRVVVVPGPIAIERNVIVHARVGAGDDLELLVNAGAL